MRPLDFIDLAADSYSDRVCILDRRGHHTYREVRAITHRLAGALHANGFHEGDRVAVYSRSDPFVLLSALGIMRAGGVFVPVNGAGAVNPTLAFLCHVRPQWLFYHEALRGETEQITPHLAPLRAVAFRCDDERLPSVHKRGLSRGVRANIARHTSTPGIHRLLQQLCVEHGSGPTINGGSDVGCQH
jgi:acyl-CoA synthetase (AMP-forming)/AMP-acid ligase II